MGRINIAGIVEVILNWFTTLSHWIVYCQRVEYELCINCTLTFSVIVLINGEESKSLSVLLCSSRVRPVLNGEPKSCQKKEQQLESSCKDAMLFNAFSWPVIVAKATNQMAH